MLFSTLIFYQMGSVDVIASNRFASGFGSLYTQRTYISRAIEMCICAALVLLEPDTVSQQLREFHTLHEHYFRETERERKPRREREGKEWVQASAEDGAQKP